MTLLPCPFCGGEAEFTRVGTSHVSCQISCTDCGAHLESGDSGHCNGSSWNRRAPAAVDRDAVLESLRPENDELLTALREAREAWAGKDWDSSRAMRCREMVDKLLGRFDAIAALKSQPAKEPTP